MDIAQVNRGLSELRRINRAKLLLLFSILFIQSACGGSALDTFKVKADPVKNESKSPVTTASIESGLYSPQTVKLACDDGDGSGCLETYYTTDGTTPNRASKPYYGPIAIWSGTTLKFFSIDNAGNTENVKTKNYFIGSVVLENVESFSAGWNHTVAIKDDGTLWAWGGNGSGQLGNETTTDSSTPIQVGTGRSWAAVQTGKFFTVAIKTDGTLWAWGLNDKGQLGNGSADDATTPIQIGEDDGWSAISAGGSHNLALKEDGALWSWGLNDKGQLGSGDTNNSSIPLRISPYSSWIAISAGFSHSVTLRDDGTIWTWGSNEYGQLGDGTNTDSNMPAKITGTNWSEISAGDYHTVALKSDGTLWSWGQNWFGQLGDGTTITKAWAGDGSRAIWGFITFDSSLPINIGTYTDWVSISAGGGHSIGIKSDGRIWAWGLNVNGQLADGTTMDNLYPLPVTAESFFPYILPKYPWAKISAGGHHTVALRSDGTLWSWGWNGSGQLGDGSTESTNGGSNPTTPTWKEPKFAYVVSDKVYTYDLNYTTGLLTTIETPSAAGTNPTAAAIHTSSKYLYVVDSSTDGESSSYVHTFGIDKETGELTEIGDPVETLIGSTSIYIDPLGRFAYVIGYHMKEWGFKVIATYTIDPVTGELTCVGTGAYGAVKMTFEPLGRFAYVIKDTLFSGINVVSYSIDQKDGKLHGIGNNDRDLNDDELLINAKHFAVDQSGQFLYIATSDSKIKVYSITQATGKIHDTGFIQAETEVSDFEFSSSNKYTYMLFSVNLNVLVVNQITGQVTDGGLELANDALGARTEPTGKFVYVYNPDSVDGYAIDPQHGTTMVIGDADKNPTSMATDAAAGGTSLKELLFASF